MWNSIVSVPDIAFLSALQIHVLNNTHPTTESERERESPEMLIC